MPKITSPQIELLERKARSLRAELNQTEEIIWAEKLALCSIKVGDLVDYRGDTYKVGAVDPDTFSKTWVRGYKRRKDGTFGTQLRNLFDYWKRIEKQSSETNEEENMSVPPVL